MVFFGPYKQTRSQYLKTDDNSFLPYCSMHSLQLLYYKALIMTYKSQEALSNKPNTAHQIQILQIVEDSTRRIFV